MTRRWLDQSLTCFVVSCLRAFYVCADSGFPKGTDDIACKIHSPLKSGHTIPADPVRQQQLLCFYKDLVSYRQTAEWGTRTIQGSFGRLRVPLGTDSKKRLRLLETCAHLTNIRARCVGISQVQNVYEPIWRAWEDEWFWDSLGDMVFGDIIKKDRVAKFHLVLEY